MLDRYTRVEALLEIGYDDLLAFRDTSQLALGVGGYVFRETFPLFMESATMARCYMKPGGYAEDRETLGMIYRNEPEGDGRLGPYVDRWFLDRPICQARRHSCGWLTALLKQETAAVSASAAYRVTSLACGTAKELFDLPAETALRILATCIDRDTDTLRSTSQVARDRDRADHITFLRADVVEVSRGLTQVALGPQRVIYALGLCDYLTDEQVRVVLDWIYDHLEGGGTVALTNLESGNPDRALMEHLLEWRVVARSEESLRDLFGQSRFRGQALTIRKDESGASLLASANK